EEAEAAVSVMSGQARYFVRDVISALRKRRETPTETVLAEVLDKYWESRLQWYAKLLLRALAEPPNPETVRAPKKAL
ncbi:MAG TPA: hypothetical protein VN699_19740, partial [Pirellulales bacterium]|nr:hypothetical protein [Pirellulales bacterium]